MEIDDKFEQIMELSEPHFFERPTGQRVALTGSLAVIVFGWFFGVDSALSFGVFMLALTVIAYLNAPGSSPENGYIWKR